MKKSMFIAELKKILRHPMLLVSVIAITFVPIMYAGMFIWSFWDPYGHLDMLPVAVVNKDKGAELDGKHLELGNKLTDNLKESKDFDFHIVNINSGYKDLENQTYYMLIEIPENFSKNATTLMDEQPKKLALKYIPNEGANYLSSKIGDSAMKEIKSSVSKQVTATYAEQMFNNIKEMAKGYDKASQGASTLFDGAKRLNSGSKTIKENLETLASKSIEFDNGLKSVKTGSSDLANGATDLKNGLSQLEQGQKKLVQGASSASNGTKDLANGTEQLKDGLKDANSGMKGIIDNTDKIHDGAKSLAENLASLENGANQTADGANKVHNGIDLLKQQLQTVLETMPHEQKAALQATLDQLDKGSTDVASGVGILSTSTSQLNAGATTLAASINQLNQDGNQKLQNGLSELLNGSIRVNDGAQQLKSGQSQLFNGMTLFEQKLAEAGNGASQVAEGSNQLNNGMAQLTNGANQFNDGTGKLAAGSKDLNEGTSKLKDGSNKLKDKLKDAADQAGSVKANQKTYDMMGAPVKVEKQGINKVPNYGTGLTPYFLSLGLFVGALLLTIVFKLKDFVIQPKSGFSWFMSKYGVMALVGIVQSLIAAAILLGGIGVEVKNIPLFIVTEIITSLTYMALIQCLTTLLGDPGRFLAIIILILQLTSSAGTFPLPLLPSALHPLHEVLPMTFSLNAFKAVISTGDFKYMWHNLGMLMVYMFAFLVITCVYFIIKHKHHIKQTEEVSI
jgi:putative membrane protein